MSHYLTNAEKYLNYIQKFCPNLEQGVVERIIETCKATCFDNPQSPLDWNNIAVMALIEAEQADNNLERAIYIQGAYDTLINSATLHPLCATHLALYKSLIGDILEAERLAYNTIIYIIHYAYQNTEDISIGLVYIPTEFLDLLRKKEQRLQRIIAAKNSYKQSLYLLNEILIKDLFYRNSLTNILQISTQIVPDSKDIYLKLGVSNLIRNQPEGLLYLYRALEIAPNYPSVVQAIFLAYRDSNISNIAQEWLDVALKNYQQESNNLDWKWATLGIDKPFTYVPFENEVLLVVQASLRSIVTSMLIVEGDWFEKELKLWRRWIQPGMVVIDVGANVGIYTFSAARRVSSTGLVVAVEPFSNCVQCLQSTCDVNNINWVKVYECAASDREGKSQLLISQASELNTLIASDDLEKYNQESIKEVTCLRLDSLIKNENLQKVDFIKIDAEGHELSVLKGAEQIFKSFDPIVFCEISDARNQDNNLAVEKFFKERQYELFYYQSYIDEFVPIEANEFHPTLATTVSLLIAVPIHKKDLLLEMSGG